MKKILFLLSLLLIIAKGLEAKKRPTRKEIGDDYRKRKKPFLTELLKRKNYFPKGIITKTSLSKCWEIGVDQNRLSIPANSEVIMLNMMTKIRKVDFTAKYENSPYAMRWHIVYNNKLYCILNKNIRPSETIIIMEGRGRSGTEAFARYILLQNGTYIEVLDYLTPYGGGHPAPAFPIIRGNYTRTENTITLCHKEKWTQLTEFREKKYKNKECTVLEKYTNQTPDPENEFEGNWVHTGRGELVIEEYIFE
ncbi:MAG: hypothetical protein OEZ22_02650 [Spirochaetia bacterium]|nr:hypothetical protein [Spirochaetia bacterium]